MRCKPLMVEFEFVGQIDSTELKTKSERKKKQMYTDYKFIFVFWHTFTYITVEYWFGRKHSTVRSQTASIVNLLSSAWGTYITNWCHFLQQQWHCFFSPHTNASLWTNVRMCISVSVFDCIFSQLSILNMRFVHESAHVLRLFIKFVQSMGEKDSRKKKTPIDKGAAEWQ